MEFKEGMPWPPESLERHKMKEHSAWFSGDADVLANFYASGTSENFLKLDHGKHNKNTFWGRQFKNKSSFYLHVPIASDIADASASFIFGETPIIRFEGIEAANDKEQEELDKLLTESKLYRKLLEAEECKSAMGGVFMKLAWDTELSAYPIPVVVQSDDAFPTFKFGKLTEVSFLHEYGAEDKSSKVFRVFETYAPSGISYKIYQGSESNLGNETKLSACPEAKDFEDVTTPCMCAFYIPNMLPNRLNRRSNHGRSDYAGIETLMDALDETFTCWMIDVQNARARMHLPQGWIKNVDGEPSFNIDQRMYVEMDADPLALGNTLLNPTQFAIRAEDMEKTCLNLLDRIITSAGYSPQSFGLNIQGRAESGTALNVRERKSYSTTAKKESYWEPELKAIVVAMCILYNEYLGGKFTRALEVNVAFSDFLANNQLELAQCIQTLDAAKALSTETKIAMLHPEWTPKQIADEVALISEQTKPEPIQGPEDNMDITQIDKAKNMLIDEEINTAE